MFLTVLREIHWWLIRLIVGKRPAVANVTIFYGGVEIEDAEGRGGQVWRCHIKPWPKEKPKQAIRTT